MWRDDLTIEELEMIAENEIIEIVPNFKKEEINLVSGIVGPFKPNKPTKIPLWLALQFKKNKKCKIIPPMWLDLKFLKNILDKEVENEGGLQEMPYYFIEICQILFNKAEDDIHECKQIKSLMEDLTTIRNGKIMKYLESLHIMDSLYIKLNNICAREIETIRLLIMEVFNKKLQIINVQNYETYIPNTTDNSSQGFMNSQDFS